MHEFYLDINSFSKDAIVFSYFGPETKKALQQFQIAHGVPGTGAWGSSSRQALWKILSEESSNLQRGGSSVYSDLHEPVSTSVDNVSTGGTDVGIRVSELLNNMGAHSQGLLPIHAVFSYICFSYYYN